MSSLLPSVLKNTRTPAEAQRASTWIERFAIPLALSAMEAQPIALVIAFLTVLVAGTKATPPFGAGSIALVALGLLWWAIMVERFARRRLSRRHVLWLHAVGWLVAFAAIARPYLLSLDKGASIFAVLLGMVLVTLLWRRSMSRAQAGFEYGELATAFKVGFGVLLGILFIAIVFPEQQVLRDALASALPIFFLSGLVMLSLVRLGAIRNAHRALDGSRQADPTRSWLIALTLFGVTLITTVIVIETVFSFASFELVLAVLTPLWNGLGTLVGWILYGIIFILTPVFSFFSWLIGLLTHHTSSKPPQQHTRPARSPFQQQFTPHALPPEILTIARWVFLVLLLCVALLVVRASLRRWLIRGDDEGIEEVREDLDARSLLGQRWRAWWNRRRGRKKSGMLLEPLDPTSARARYREMLQALATSNGGLARAPTETPAEYEMRLLAHMGREPAQSADPASNGDAATESTILDELTHAYTRERYGGKHTDARQREHLRTWVPRLIARLTGRGLSNSPTNRARS